MMVLEGCPEYKLNFNTTDQLSSSQRVYCEMQLRQFKSWYATWRAALS
jgi:4-hydroxy-tetrahydrodipicolinate synthase